MILGRRLCSARLTKHPSRFSPLLSEAGRGANRWQSSISPILIQRARALASEHASLQESVAENFDIRSARRLGELSAVAQSLKEWDESHKNITELQALLNDPSADAELRFLATEDLEQTVAQQTAVAKSLTRSLIPPHPFAHLPCLVEIRPGVGGSEAALFAGDLFRMYRALCSRRGFRFTMLKFDSPAGASDPGSKEAPVEEAIFEIETPGSYGELRCEAGVHRVQRVPATEAKGRTHTSVASVLVLPSIKDESEGLDDINDPNSDYFVDPKDVRTDTMRARGAGGQHVNTTDSAIRLTHLPTNTVVSMQDSRSQMANRTKAWQILRARLAQARREAREEEKRKLRSSIKGVSSAGRADKIRTYNWLQQRVTDHRSGLTTYSLDNVVEGGAGLDEIIESVKGWMMDQELQAMVEEDQMADGTGK